MKSFKQSHPQDYDRIYGDIANLVKDLIEYWKKNDRQGIIQNMRKNEDYLRELGHKSGVGIETQDLKMLSDIANECGAAGKLSGAGGGDCGIAVAFGKETADNVKEKWKDNNIYLIDATVDKEGVRVDSN